MILSRSGVDRLQQVGQHASLSEVAVDGGIKYRTLITKCSAEGLVQKQARASIHSQRQHGGLECAAQAQWSQWIVALVADQASSQQGHALVDLPYRVLLRLLHVADGAGQGERRFHFSERGCWRAECGHITVAQWQLVPITKKVELILAGQAGCCLIALAAYLLRYATLLRALASVPYATYMLVAFAVQVVQTDLQNPGGEGCGLLLAVN